MKNYLPKKLVLTTLILIFLTSCTTITTAPEDISTAERDAMLPKTDLPLSAEVKIYWNENRIPFIHAQSDEDLAFTIGLIHAHLRLGQMEFFKRAAHGRLSEMAGPLAVDVDKTIRIFDFGHAVPQMIADMDPKTRLWTERYLAGINTYINSLERTSPDFAALNIDPVPWTMEELMTTWRLVATDVNWFYLLGFLNNITQPGWRTLWDKNVEIGKLATVSYDETAFFRAAETLPLFFSKSGSNSLAVSGSKTPTGAALMANDPHLGLTIPNFWVLVGYKSPSYHTVGFMIPGLPFMAVGRNPDIAWGGTNMRALSSYLYQLDEDDLEGLPFIEEEIKVRGWFDTSVKRRFSAHGPVLTDSPLFDDKERIPFPVAMRWMGHESSDEVTAFLAANRARNWQEFRAAWEPYAVSAQNLLYADKEGNIGQVLAYRQPLRKDNTRRELLTMTDNPWTGSRKATELPSGYNPASGFIASANNKPTDLDVDLGWFFSENDRVERLQELAGVADTIDIAMLKAWHLDVYSQSAHALAKAISEKMRLPDETLAEYPHIAAMRNWDGHYREESKGALATELVYFHIAGHVYGKKYPNEDIYAIAMRGNYSYSYVRELIGELPQNEFDSLLTAAAQKSKDDYLGYINWGGFHRLKVQFLLGNVPALGESWVFYDLPTAGSTQTLMKTALSPTEERHNSPYGANARHISDLSDPDANYFVLLGGQDGWLKSPQTLDQVEKWRQGEYIHFPLRLASIRAAFTTVMTLNP
jgi:penicillin amidase